MISLADKLVSCGHSRPPSPSFFTGLSSSGVSVAIYGVATVGSVSVVCGKVFEATAYSFVASISASGEVVWQRKLTSSVSVSGMGIACDSAGNVYVLVINSASVAFISLCKYSAEGVLQWQRAVSDSTGAITDSQLCVSPSGEIYIGVPGAVATPRQFTLIKYNDSGVLQWQKRFNSSTLSLSLYGTTLDAGGNVYVGYVSSTNYLFIDKFNNAGGLLSSLRKTGISQAGGMCIDASGNVHVAGRIENYPSILKFNSALAYQGVLRIGDIAASFVHGVSVSGSGLIAVGKKYFIEFDSAMNLIAQRTIAITDGYFTKAGGSSESYMVCGVRGKASSATVDDALLMHITAAADLGVYGPVTITEATYVPQSISAPVDTTQVVTYTTGTLTDAAGTLTDAAGTLSSTVYTKA